MSETPTTAPSGEEQTEDDAVVARALTAAIRKATVGGRANDARYDADVDALLARLADYHARLSALHTELERTRAALTEAATRIKKLDWMLVEHHSASIMREEHSVCPVCTVEMFEQNGALYKRLAALGSPDATTRRTE